MNRTENTYISDDVVCIVCADVLNCCVYRHSLFILQGRALLESLKAVKSFFFLSCEWIGKKKFILGDIITGDNL